MFSQTENNRCLIENFNRNNDKVLIYCTDMAEECILFELLIGRLKGMINDEWDNAFMNYLNLI